MVPDHKHWQTQQHYRHTQTLDAKGWAWELLRRNPEYQQAYAEFIATWQALENDYGQRPQRDFFRWKQDPRAYQQAPQCRPGESIEQWQQRSGQDCVLIECAFSARWGLKKFPPDPSLNAAQLGDKLDWQPLPQLAHIIGPQDHDPLHQIDGQIALGFDLRAPLRDQLEQAKRFLIARQRHLQKRQGLNLRSVASESPRWLNAIRLLDATQAQASPQQIAASLNIPEQQIPERLNQAQQLRDQHYREPLQHLEPAHSHTH